MESFPSDNANSSKVIVTEPTQSVNSPTNSPLRTRSGRTPDTLRQKRGRSKTFTGTGTSTLNGSLIKASWPSPGQGNNANTNRKAPLSLNHFSSSPNLTFGGRLTSSNTSAFVFGSGTNVFASASAQNLAHRNSDNEEAMDIDSQDDMDTQVEQTDTSASSETRISSTSKPCAVDVKETDSAGSADPSVATDKGEKIISEQKTKDFATSGPKISSPKVSSSPQKTSYSKLSSEVSPAMVNKPVRPVLKSSGKKKAIYIVLHVGQAQLGQLKAKALAPIKIYAEKVFMELELAEGASLSLKIPFKDLSECLVTFESPNPVVAFTLTNDGAKSIADKNKEKMLFSDLTTQECWRRRIIFHINSNSIPRDVKADFIELFQKRMSDKISWSEMSANELKAKLDAKESATELENERNEAVLQAKDKSDDTTTGSSTMSPSGSNTEARKILTPKKSSSARRKLYERTPSSPSKPNLPTSDNITEQIADIPASDSKHDHSTSDLQMQTRNHRPKDKTSTSDQTVSSSSEQNNTTSSSNLEMSSAVCEMRDTPMSGIRDSSSIDSATRAFDSPSNLRDVHSRPRDSTSGKLEGHSRLRDSASETSACFPTSPGVKRNIFSRLTSDNVRDIFPSINDETFQSSSVTPPPRSDVTPEQGNSGVTSNASFNGYRDAEISDGESPPNSKMRDVLHHHGKMETHINELGKHSEKQRYTLEQHQKLLTLERAERSRNIETIRDLRLTLSEREHLVIQQRDEIALLTREIEAGRVALQSARQELEQERDSSSRLRQLQSDLTVARRSLDEERVLRNLREQQIREKERTLGELQRFLGEETQTRRNLESELRTVRSACLQHMDELENQRLFRQSQDREIKGREDRITASEQRYHEEHAVRVRLEEEMRRLRLECEEQRQEKETLQGELNQERERISTERTRMGEERQDYQQRLEANDLTITHCNEQLRERDAALEQAGRRLRELQAAVNTRQTMLDDSRRIEHRDWLIRREEVTLTEVALGTGAWGTVKIGKFRGSKVAVKQIHELILSPHNRRLFEREMSIASRCRHPCLLQFIGATNDDGIPLFLTEILDTDLRAVLSQRALHQEEIIIIALDCARALNYLHMNKPYPIIHRDISSSNVLLWKRDTCWRAKLSDYGAANFMRQYMTVNPGASIYAAPEASTSTQSAKVDVYSFGLLLCELCIRELPVKEQTSEQVNLITSGVLRELVMRCIQREPEVRPSMGEVITLLEQQRENLRDRGLVHRSAAL